MDLQVGSLIRDRKDDELYEVINVSSIAEPLITVVGIFGSQKQFELDEILSAQHHGNKRFVEEGCVTYFR